MPKSTTKPGLALAQKPIRGKQISLPESVKELKRKVTIAHCRSWYGPEIPIWQFAADVDDEVRSDEDGVWHGLRMWQYYAAGKFDIDTRRLELMEKSVPGTIKLYEHAFWILISGRELSHEQLVDIVRKLPPKLVAICLTIPDSNYDFVEPQRGMIEEDFEAVQSLGSLDAVAALLALSRLFQEDHMEAMDKASVAVDCATRLLSQLSLDPPYNAYAEEIWKLISQQYLRVHGLDETHQLQAMRTTYFTILGFFGSSGFKAQWPQERIALLTLVDRRHFESIGLLVEAGINDPLLIAAYASHPAISAILEAYTKHFGSYFNEWPPQFYWPIADEKLRALDKQLDPLW